MARTAICLQITGLVYLRHASWRWLDMWTGRIARVCHCGGDLGNPELVQLMLRHIARSAAGGWTDHEGHRDGGGRPLAGLLQEYMDLITVIRDTGMDPAQLRALLGLNPETRPPGGDNPDPSMHLRAG